MKNNKNIEKILSEVREILSSDNLVDINISRDDSGKIIFTSALTKII